METEKIAEPQPILKEKQIKLTLHLASFVEARKLGLKRVHAGRRWSLFFVFFVSKSFHLFKKQVASLQIYHHLS